jgi:hypothetical protein
MINTPRPGGGPELSVLFPAALTTVVSNSYQGQGACLNDNEEGAPLLEGTLPPPCIGDVRTQGHFGHPQSPVCAWGWSPGCVPTLQLEVWLFSAQGPLITAPSVSHGMCHDDPGQELA